MARVGLVLGAGGAAGHAFHVGVLAALEEATGWDARRSAVVVGTSAGSLVAANLRMGLRGSDQAAPLLGRALSPQGAALSDRMGDVTPLPRRARAGLRPAAPLLLARSLLRPGRVRAGTLGSGLLPAGTVDNTAIVARLARVAGPRWTDEPLLICAARLSDGARVAFGSHGAPATDVPTAVRASCAIPGYWSPVTIDARRYVDGGVHSPTNADLLAAAPWAGNLDLIVISSPMSAARGTRARTDAGPRTWATDTAGLAVRAAAGRYLAGEVAALRAAGTAVVVFQPGAADLAAAGLNPMARGRTRHIAAQALRTTRERLTAGGAATRALRLLEN